MSDEQTSFKVTDRRLFNPDGTPREVPEDERPEVKPEPPQAAVSADVGAATAPTAEVDASPVSTEASEPNQPQPTAADESGHAEPPDSELDAELPGAKDPASFTNFMMSIASNAASSLGMMEHPVTGKREVDLELGKHWIDILGMLEQKTRGNLLPQEAQIIEGLLADLRMQYVSLTNATPKARTYTSRDITGG
jgi:hypothetical protein